MLRLWESESEASPNLLSRSSSRIPIKFVQTGCWLCFQSYSKAPPALLAFIVEQIINTLHCFFFNISNVKFLFNFQLKPLWSCVNACFSDAVSSVDVLGLFAVEFVDVYVICRVLSFFFTCILIRRPCMRERALGGILCLNTHWMNDSMLHSTTLPVTVRMWAN